MTVETLFLTGGLTSIRDVLITGDPISTSSFRIGTAAGFSGDPTATDVTGTLAYVGSTSQVTSATDLDGNLVYTVTMAEEVGDFSVGNLMLMVTDATGETQRPLIHVILPRVLPKTASAGGNPGNLLAFRITIDVVDGSTTTTVNVTVANESIGVLPTVANESLLPAPGPSAFQHYVIHGVSTTDAPAIAMRRVSDNTWWGNGFVQRIDDHRFGWLWGGQQADGYIITSNVPTIFGGFFETSSGKYQDALDGGGDWGLATEIEDGGTW